MRSICASRLIPAILAVLVPTLLVVPSASADIIKIQSQQSCNVNGLDLSPATAIGGVHCDNGSPFSLSAFLTGAIALFVGNSQTPSWNLINDTGSSLSSLSFYYTGALASNAYIDMQISGTTIFRSCTATTAAGVVTTDPNCGSADKTTNQPLLPLLMVWSGGTGLASGAVFNIGTASFAHAGVDAGCISGTSNCQPVPEPSSRALLGVGLLSIMGMMIGSRVRESLRLM
jgi:hypothetical protein